jgi:hypothetical protein
MNVNRRSFLVQAGAASLSAGILATPVLAADDVSAMDRERMRSVAAFTAMCGGWAGRARGLRETLYRSAHAKGVRHVEEALRRAARLPS